MQRAGQGGEAPNKKETNRRRTRTPKHSDACRKRRSRPRARSFTGARNVRLSDNLSKPMARGVGNSQVAETRQTKSPFPDTVLPRRRTEVSGDAQRAVPSVPGSRCRFAHGSRAFRKETPATCLRNRYAGAARNTGSTRDIHGSAANASFGSRQQNEVGIQAEKGDTAKSGNKRNNTERAKPPICHSESVGNPARDRGVTSIARVCRDIASFEPTNQKYDRIRTDGKLNTARTPEIDVDERRQSPGNPAQNRGMASIAKVCRDIASFEPTDPECGSDRKEDECNTGRTPGIGIVAGRQTHGNPALGASTPNRNSVPLYGPKSQSVRIGINRMNAWRQAPMAIVRAGLDRIAQQTRDDVKSAKLLLDRL